MLNARGYYDSVADLPIKVLDAADALAAIADPLRARIFKALAAPMTAKQLAAQLRVPTTRLYYHLKVLEQHGFIAVVSRRLVSGIEERTISRDGEGMVPFARAAAVCLATEPRSLAAAVGRGGGRCGARGAAGSCRGS